ncbi:MAG: hypothetical protein CMA59_00090 [Euryarchaeota archaeon]|nr:hypothetical protein [Euryarchaeota archaeon]|tara:strand:+ start:1742 stop:1948 length:207 start_codon:yes stop_codon:yes gene_type:complete
MSETIIFTSNVPRGSRTGPTNEEKTGVANRPVDMSDNFKKNGWEYCKYLITDPRSDSYLKKSEEGKKE